MKVISQLYDEASGSIGNLTAASGNGGQYFKQKSNPRNPNTAYQQVVRNALAGANSAWMGMSVAVRETWETWAGTLTSDNILGTAITVSGWSAFAGSYVLMTQASLPTATIIAGAPATAGYASSSNITINADNDVLNVVSTDATVRKMSVYVSTAQRKTINNYGDGYRFNVNDDVSNNDTAVTTKAVIAGKRYFVKVQVVELDGRYSKPTTTHLDT